MSTGRAFTPSPDGDHATLTVCPSPAPAPVTAPRPTPPKHASSPLATSGTSPAAAHSLALMRASGRKHAANHVVSQNCGRTSPSSGPPPPRFAHARPTAKSGA
ncbi:hypothetical protein CDD82_6912 [Ophiocordyceps australis]|uniref:Uncharacterized protein n=1 Tax=Ophiocordyceps australis TaxID=1399860 RepID=A0A2C5XFT0_9HYPO|nr:hypothetical protein CDD82_6912 [Ophiocordyceps australis]